MIAVPFMTSKIDEIPDFNKLADDMKKRSETGDLDEDTFKFAKTNGNSVFEERMWGVVEDMYKFGYI